MDKATDRDMARDTARGTVEPAKICTETRMAAASTDRRSAMAKEGT